MTCALIAALSFFALADAETPVQKAVSEPVGDAAKRVLTTKDFPFCRPSQGPVPRDFRHWCALADEATTCPELKEACAQPLDANALEGEGGGWFGRGRKPKTKVGAGDSEDAASRGLLEFDGLGVWVKVLGWVVLGVVAGFLLILLVMVIRERRRAERTAEMAEPIDATPLAWAIDEPAGLGEVEQLLREARRAADADADVGRALMLLYAATLKHLEDKGFVEFEATTTNREYVRQVRGKTPLDGPLTSLVREVERTRFGRREASRDAFELHFSELAPMLRRLASTAGVVLILALAACGGDPSLDGRAAFNEIARTQGIEPARLAKPFDQIGFDDPPVLLDAEVIPPDAELLRSLERSFLAGARFLVLLDGRQQLDAWPSLRVVANAPGEAEPELVADPPDAGLSDAGAPEPTGGGVSHVVLSKEFELAAGLPEGTSAKVQGHERFAPITDGRTPPEVLATRDGEPFAVRWRSERGVLVVVADRRLFANGSMAVPGNAAVALALVEAVVRRDGQGRATLATAAVGLARPSQSPQESLEKSGMMAVLLQSLAALALFFAAKGMAFGTLRDRARPERREFREHVAALGLQLARRRGSRLAASLYASWVLERLRQRVVRDGNVSDTRALARVLARRTGDDEGALFDLLETAEALRREPKGPGVPERDLATIRRLGALLSKLQNQPVHTRSA